MKKNLLFIFVILSVQIFAQSYDPEKINPKAIDVFERAILKLRDGEIKDAIPFLLRAYEIDTNYVDAVLSLAGAYGELKLYSKATLLYEKGRKMDTVYFKYYFLPYSINLAGDGKFDEALLAIHQFLNIAELNDRSKKAALYRKKAYEFAIQYLATHPKNNYTFSPINLGDSINSDKSEYYPSITIDDSLFVFTRRGQGYREDFFESVILPNKTYQKSKLINGDINEEPSKGAINISLDGEWLLFAGYNFRGGYGDFDLYISYNTPTGWSEPENLGYTINSEFWESSPSISPDKQTLYFSSSRLGGYGGKDVYVSYRQPNGRWSMAKNMGPEINTSGDELAPFIHADNATLYFTSDGLPGYGNSDLFVVRKGIDGQWGKPENLGFPINTIENEGSIYLAADGVTAYYSSDRSDSRGGLDIYKFEMRPDIRPAKTLYVQGYVFDAKTNKGLPCTVELIENNERKSITKLQTDETGFYFVTLPTGKDYTFSVNRKGYLFYTKSFEFTKDLSDSTYRINIQLKPIELNVVSTLNNILFKTNSFDLLPVSIIELDKLVVLLNENPNIKIQINGHTDNTGVESENKILSNARAKSVVEYLKSKNIATDRLLFKGFGSSKPIADNNTEEGKQKNRRTEFEIIRTEK
jgi:outer membrane protein OmpA-like peptidoglycan-associated protein/tetratricopeptide (TPR) repeat protein